jgi:hypothetical protein
VWTLVTTAHGDEQLGFAGQFLGKLLGFGIAEVNSNFLHDRQHLGMDSQTRLRPCRDGLCLLGVGEMVEKGSGHL